jgi:MOSC domain-containing protein YiiM
MHDDSVASATVVAIWIKRFKHGPMDAVASARLIAGRGIAGNADQGGKRQITLLDESAWRDVSASLHAEVDPRLRRANVMLRGIDLYRTHRRTLRIGACRIRIYGEVTPCRKMEESLAGLQEAMRPRWRGGAFGEVLDDGEIAVGDAVSWLEEQLPLLGGC